MKVKQKSGTTMSQSIDSLVSRTWIIFQLNVFY